VKKDDGHLKFKQNSFSYLVDEDDDLACLRKRYASKPPDERRMAADFEYHSAMASDLFQSVLARAGQEGLESEYWPPGVLALAIDPEYAPALLTVGSLEYQLGRRGEGLDLFMKLTRLGKDEKDLPEIIDKAGCFLLDNNDYENALELYSAAEKSDPGQSLYFNSSGYCLGKLRRFKEAVEKCRQAAALEPENYEHLNDLGFSLMEAGDFPRAEKALKRSKSLAPPDYELSANNLKELQRRKRKAAGAG
jgi:Flp pilus assembly protein TadD